MEHPIDQDSSVIERRTIPVQPPANTYCCETSSHDRHTIHCIPTRVLLRIFQYIYDDERPNLSSSIPYLSCTLMREMSKWELLSHVCQRWRYLVLECPSVWSFISLGQHSPERIVAYLARSQRAPLDVDVVCARETVTDVEERVGLVAHHASRIRSLGVNMVCWTSIDVLLPLLENMRDIESLRILSFPRSVAMKSFAPNNPWHRLRTLHLCCFLPCVELHPWFVNVTELRLQESTYSVAPAWSDFTSFVKSMAMLRILIVEDYVWDETRTTKEDEVITMSLLEKVELLLSAKACSFLLDRMDLSKAKEIDIVCKNYDVDDSVLIPVHLSNVRCSSLKVSSRASAIAFSTVFQVEQLEQRLNVTLCLTNGKAFLSRMWLKLLIGRWIVSLLFSDTIGGFDAQSGQNGYDLGGFIKALEL